MFFYFSKQGADLGDCGAETFLFQKQTRNQDAHPVAIFRQREWDGGDLLLLMHSWGRRGKASDVRSASLSDEIAKFPHIRSEGSCTAACERKIEPGSSFRTKEGIQAPIAFL